MKKKFLGLIILLFLSGCGAFLWEDTSYLEGEFPDIRTVPNRVAANASRGIHEGNERCARINDLQKLEQERQQIQARDQALRKEVFGSSP